jgi:ATP adenylyltransferase
MRPSRPARPRVRRLPTASSQARRSDDVKVLWAPWRLSYVSSVDTGTGCIFCDKPRAATPEARSEHLVLRTTEHASVLMNLFPYANGHLMVAPRAHTAEYARLDAVTSQALQSELQRSVRVLTRAFSPAGFNIGMNLGRAAGAGITEHLHWHVVPRWVGDTNFMPALADTRVMPEHIANTYSRLLPLFEDDKE